MTHDDESFKKNSAFLNGGGILGCSQRRPRGPWLLTRVSVYQYLYNI